jgi:hypothetical protein
VNENRKQSSTSTDTRSKKEGPISRNIPNKLMPLQHFRPHIKQMFQQRNEKKQKESDPDSISHPHRLEMVK